MLTEFVRNDPKIPHTNGLILSHSEESFEIVGSSIGSPILLTCEHASNSLPPPHSWQHERTGLQDSHWAFDPGAADLTRELAQAIRAPALLSRWSRLWVDLNRPVDSPTLFRSIADGAPILLNNDLSQAEAEARIAHAYTPYHTTLQLSLIHI